MSERTQRLLHKYYSHIPHPYRIFEQEVEAIVADGRVKTFLDAGCGRTAPVLRKYLGRVDRLIGIDLVPFTEVPPGIETYVADLAMLPLADNSVDLIISRSVFEHLTNPDAVYRDFARVLRPGGRVVFLTANMWDYGTLVARLVPNRLHARVVRYVEGRNEEDTFPTAYRTNTRADIGRLAGASGLSVLKFRYLSQYPNYLLFNAALFMIGTLYEKIISRFDTLKVLRGWLLVTLEKPKN